MRSVGPMGEENSWLLFVCSGAPRCTGLTDLRGGSSCLLLVFLSPMSQCLRSDGSRRSRLLSHHLNIPRYFVEILMMYLISEDFDFPGSVVILPLVPVLLFIYTNYLWWKDLNDRNKTQYFLLILYFLCFSLQFQRSGCFDRSFRRQRIIGW